MHIKKIFSAFIVSAMIICNTDIVYASDTAINELTEQSIQDINIKEKDISTQLNELYDKVSNEIGLDAKYIRQLHLLAGGKAVYADTKPNIYNDITIESENGPLDICGAHTEYKRAPFALCPDEKVVRPCKYYIPDAVSQKKAQQNIDCKW